MKAMRSVNQTLWKCLPCILSVALLSLYIAWETLWVSLSPSSAVDHNAVMNPNAAAGSATSGKLWRIEHKVNSLELPEYRHIARNIHRGQPLKYDKQCVSEYWIVLTTIFNVTSAILDYNEMQGWCTVIAADKKSVPSSAYNQYLNQRRVIYLDVEQQRNIFTEWNKFQTYDIIPFNHFGRKNLGYLYAMMNGAKYIYDTDDDNKVIEPFNKLGVPIFSETETNGQPNNVMPVKHMKNENRIKDELTFNVFLLWSADAFIWPRGYDLALLTDSFKWHQSVRLDTVQTNTAGLKERFIIQQWLSDIEPDFDALQRIIGKNIDFSDKEEFVMEYRYSVSEENKFAVLLPNHLYVPFNAQMTTWDYRAFLFLYLPISVHGRVSDIWRSYFAQTVMHVLQLNGVANWNLLYCPVLVNQYRNPHDYLADFQSELPLYLQTHQLLIFLHRFAADYELRADDGQRAADISNVNVGQILLDLYIELYEYNVLQMEDVKGIYAWIHDIVQHVGWMPIK